MDYSGHRLMGKGKLAKFAELETFPNVFQFPYSVMDDVECPMKGRWGEGYFHNDHPIVLELGCGKGEYTVELGRMFPDVNFIGVDIKATLLVWTSREPVCGLEPSWLWRSGCPTWRSCVPTSS